MLARTTRGQLGGEESCLSTYLSILLAMTSMLFSVLLGAPIVVDDEGSATMAPASRDVRLPSDVRLRYLEQGPATGPAILFLHGYTDSSFSFSRILPLLPPEWRVIVPDQRGHGASDRPEAGYAVDDFATDALQLMDALRVESAVVVGHSMGSFIARRIAERAPARVTQLVLVGSGPTAATAAVVELQDAVAALTAPPDPAFVREFQESMVVRPVPRAFMEQAIAASESVPVRVWKAALSGLLGTRLRAPCDAVRSSSAVTPTASSRERIRRHSRRRSLAPNWRSSKGLGIPFSGRNQNVSSTRSAGSRTRKRGYTRRMRGVPRTVATMLLLTCPGLPGAALAQGPPEALTRARSYVVAYSELFANLLSEERSRQELRDPTGVESVPATARAMPGAPPIQETFVTTARVTRQNLLANYLVVRAETGLGWVPLRDEVYRWSNRPHVLTVASRYTNYRRLDVSTTSGVGKPPPRH